MRMSFAYDPVHRPFIFGVYLHPPKNITGIPYEIVSLVKKCI